MAAAEVVRTPHLAAGAADFEPERGPLTPAQLNALAISDSFVTYLRQFPNMVRDA